MEKLYKKCTVFVRTDLNKYPVFLKPPRMALFEALTFANDLISVAIRADTAGVEQLVNAFGRHHEFAGEFVSALSMAHRIETEVFVRRDDGGLARPSLISYTSFYRKRSTRAFYFLDARFNTVGSNYHFAFGMIG